jgi:hypothetical protein
MTAVTHGHDELALTFLKKGLELARIMGLLNVDPQSHSAASWFHGYPDWQMAASYTAWGTFNWAS